MAIPKRIIRIGMKSSGKTTAGRLLARMAAMAAAESP